MGNQHTHHYLDTHDQSVTTTSVLKQSSSALLDSSISRNETKNEDTFTSQSLFGVHRTSIFIVNDAVGKYISKRLVSIASMFWFRNIEPLGMEEKLEVACSIFFSMLSANKQMRRLMKPDSVSNIKLETMSLKFLGKLGWLLRTLVNPQVDAYSLLKQVGRIHQENGIKVKHFNIMIKAVHDTMSYYFPRQYNIDVQYAMEEIITLTSRIMIMDVDIVDTSCNSQSRTKTFHGVNTVFVESLEVCLLSEIGREYFYRYLHQNGCAELTVYLELIKKFKNQTSDKQRYVVAKDLMKECIYPNSEFAVNISYETRNALLDSFQKISQVSIDYFKNVEMEIRRLIIKNHWNAFVRNICELHNSANMDHLLR